MKHLLHTSSEQRTESPHVVSGKECRRVRTPMAEWVRKLATWGLKLALISLAGGLWQVPVMAQELGATSEYQVEAAFLYHFAKFVEWPAGTFAQTNSPVTIGILGEDPFGDALEGTVRNKTIDNRPFRIVHLDMKSLAEAKRCQILFICPSEKRRVNEVLEALKNTSVLTVSKMDRFLQAGGMINFLIQDKKVRFEINNEQARLAGLKISAKLLSLARPKEGE